MCVHCLIPYADVTSGMHTVDIGIDAGGPAGSQKLVLVGVMEHTAAKLHTWRV